MSLGKPIRKPRVKSKKKEKRIPPNFDMYYNGTSNISPTATPYVGVPSPGGTSDYIEGGAGGLAATSTVTDSLGISQTPVGMGVNAVGFAGGLAYGHSQARLKNDKNKLANITNENIQAGSYNQDPYAYQTPIMKKGTQGIKKYAQGSQGLLDENQQGAMNLGMDLLGAFNPMAGAMGGQGMMPPQGAPIAPMGNMPIDPMQAAQSGRAMQGAVPMMKQGGEVFKKTIETEQEEIKLRPQKNGDYKLERNYTGSGYDKHEKGGVIDDDAQEGDVIFPVAMAKEWLKSGRIKGGDKSTGVGGRISGNDLYRFEADKSKLPKDTDIPQYANGVDEIDPTYKRSDLGAMPKFGNPQEMQDHFRENQIDPRQFSQDVGFYDTGGGFGFTEGIENKDPGFMARANAPQGSKDYGDKYSDVQEDYFRNFNDSRGAVTNPPAPRVAEDIIVAVNPRAIGGIPPNTSGRGGGSMSPINIPESIDMMGSRPTTLPPAASGRALQGAIPPTEDGLPTTEPASRGYRSPSHLGETLPTAYSLAQGMFGNRDTLDLQGIDPETPQYRNLSEQDYKSAKESAAIGRYNLGKRHMSRGQGIGEAANVESMLASQMGRINQGETKRYDNIQNAGIGIRNNAQAYNANATDQETMYDKQVMGKQSEYLGRGLEGAAGLAQNRYQRDMFDSRLEEQRRMDTLRLGLQENAMGGTKVKDISGVDPTAYGYQPRSKRRKLRKKK